MTDSKTMFPKVAVRAIIQNSDGKILILKRANTGYCEGYWNLPGGKVDFGQTAEEAVIREVEEETMLKTEKAKFLFYMDNLPDETTDLHFVNLFFECVCTGEVTINNESSECQWINRDDLKSLNLAFGHDEAIRRYYSESD
jgi:8-oxo-dGTP diphosphatase